MTCGDENRPFTFEIAQHVVVSPLDRKKILKNSSEMLTQFYRMPRNAFI